MRLRPALGLLLVGVVAGPFLQPTPASAAACAAGSGVTVVVGSAVSCDADGGGTAADSFRDAGHVLTPVDRQPGFVCRVDGAPDSAGCVTVPPSDAYWGLFWSDGRSGTWTYASEGVGSLKVPAGGWVALVFQDSPDRSLPAVVPTGSTAPARAGAGTTSPRTVSGASGGPGQLGWVAAGLAVALLGGAAFLVRHRAAGGSS